MWSGGIATWIGALRDANAAVFAGNSASCADYLNVGALSLLLYSVLDPLSLLVWFVLSRAFVAIRSYRQDLGLPMLSDIKNQLNQMKSMQLELMTSASRDAEAIAEVVRNEIRRAMMVKGKSGITIRDTIDEKIAHLERDDDEDDRSRSQRCVCILCVIFYFSFSFSKHGSWAKYYSFAHCLSQIHLSCSMLARSAALVMVVAATNTTKGKGGTHPNTNTIFVCLCSTTATPSTEKDRIECP